jgi:hypothetical protein
VRYEKGETVRQLPAGSIDLRTESIQCIQDKPSTLRTIADVDVIPKTLTLGVWRPPIKHVLLWESVALRRIDTLCSTPALLL